MNQHPIIFSTPMVRGILDGRKTQTRRIIKPQPYKNGDTWHYNKKSFGNSPPNEVCNSPIPGLKCPYGQPGDLLWVRETWAPAMGEICFKADYSDKVLSEKRNKGLWKPSIHMPKAAARLWLKITDVRVERLHDISEKDAIAEGCTRTRKEDYSAEWDFADLWESIYGGESWEANPWVWVIVFDRIIKPQS